MPAGRWATWCACVWLAGCGGESAIAPGAGTPPGPAPVAAPLPPPTPAEAAAEAAEDAALARLQALKPQVTQVLNAVRETTSHPGPPGPARLAELADELDAVAGSVAGATRPDDPVAAILRAQYDDWLSEAQSILAAWRAGKRPPAAAPMMGH